MGMTIDEAIKEIESITVVTDEKQALAFALAVHTMKKYQQLQADYENRLKADMVAILKDLQYDLCHELCKEIHIKEDCPCTNQTTSCLAAFRVCDADRAIGRVIQQKINALKGEE